MLQIIVKYIVLPSVIAFGLMGVAKPSEEEIRKIKAHSPSHDQFTHVLRAAANPNSKPIYRQKPGEAHPLPEMSEGKTKKT